jgi:lipopolysaccharide biosynthesis protein
MKLIAFYLPQFHPIPENDRWWGQGFTEWTNTRWAAPLFPGHYQPREPWADNYYSLLDSRARSWQADVARSHGIYGFCYYHYWFAGSPLLERPFNEVLRSGQPEFPFCLSWANEPWSRVWDGRRREILVRQEYGDASMWRRHFEDLLPAFRDPRYIRVDGRPLFVVYRPSSIPRPTAMFDLWRSLAREHGLEGLHLVHTLNTFERRPVPGFDGTIDLEPLCTLAGPAARFWRWRRKGRGLLLRATRRDPRAVGRRFLDVIDYDRVWEMILNRPNPPAPRNAYRGAFMDWDNTPRRGNRATIFLGATPQKFERYLERQLARAESAGAGEFLFVNAWNEWAEGAYLEPDRRCGFQYLQAVQRVTARRSPTEDGLTGPRMVSRTMPTPKPPLPRTGSA